MGSAFTSCFPYQQEIETLKKAVKQLEDLMEITKGTQDALKKNLMEVQTITGNAVDKFRASVSKIDILQDKFNDIEGVIQRKVDSAIKKGLGGAVTKFL